MSAGTAALAAIEFWTTLDDHEGTHFLYLWYEGMFPEIREDWPEAPEEIYIGADPLNPETKGTQSPAVGGLVEALEDIAATWHHSPSCGQYFADVARAALSAYREQQGGVNP